MFRIRLPYLGWALLLFVIEVGIALFVTDRIIRPYVGDFLVVILIYCSLRGVLNIGVKAAAAASLLFAYTVEGLQYLALLDRLGWRSSALANVVLGNRFEWIDMLAYTLGVGAVLVIERYRKHPK